MENKVDIDAIFEFWAEVSANVSGVEAKPIVNYILEYREDIVCEIEYAVNEYIDTSEISNSSVAEDRVVSEEIFNAIVEEIYDDYPIYDDICDIVEQFNPCYAVALDVLEMLVEEFVYQV